MLIQVLYSSRSIYPRGDLSDIEILRQAAKNNRTKNITGALLRDTRRFLQVLEGDKNNVLPIIKNITSDPRHYDMVLHWQRAISERSFGGWSMGYSEIDDRFFSDLENLDSTDAHALDATFHRLQDRIQTMVI